MWEENVEAVRAVYERWGQGDFRAAVKLFDPYVVLVLRPGFLDEGALFRGRSSRGVHKGLAGDGEGSHDGGGGTRPGRGQRLGEGASGRVGSKSGLPIDVRYFTLWSFRGDNVIRIESFVEHADALEAAGLREWAMSQENVEIVRKAFDDFNAFMRGELSSEAYADLLDPQIEVDFYEERIFPDFPQHLRGIPEFIGWVEDVREAMDELAQPLEFIEASGDRVLIPTRQSGRGRESGVPFDLDYFLLFTIRDGKVRNLEFFPDHAEAFEAAGLRE
jgi:ketosteroid isomerase-like protein